MSLAWVEAELQSLCAASTKSALETALGFSDTPAPAYVHVLLSLRAQLCVGCRKSTVFRQPERSLDRRLLAPRRLLHAEATVEEAGETGSKSVVHKAGRQAVDGKVRSLVCQRFDPSFKLANLEN